MMLNSIVEHHTRCHNTSHFDHNLLLFIKVILQMLCLKPLILPTKPGKHEKQKLILREVCECEMN